MIDSAIIVQWRIGVKQYSDEALDNWLKRSTNVREWQDILEEEKKLRLKKSRVKVDFT